MTIDPMLIERIYEAAALPNLWPTVLQNIADQAGSKGALFLTSNKTGVSWIVSPRLERDVSDYFAAGWSLEATARGVMAEQFPGFRTETDYLSAEEIARMPVHAEFFDPRGLIAGAATLLQGAKDDLLMCIMQGFATHDRAEAAIPWLDALRAPLGRAMSLTSRLRDAKAGSAVSALDLANVAAAIVSDDGRLRAANDRFAARLGNRLIDRQSGVRFADRFLQAQFSDALAALDAGAGVRSIAVAAIEDQPACVIHLLPLKRGARDVFGWDGVLLLLAEAANASVPNADLLRLLFDLTPAEARLTRYLVEGRTSAEAAALLSITDATARTHLRRIFAKTGVRRQAELVRLLLGLGDPPQIFPASGQSVRC